MKKTLAVAVIIGCLLLLANVSVAVGASITPVSIKKTLDTTTLSESDYQVVEDENKPFLDEGIDTSSLDMDSRDTSSSSDEEQVVTENGDKIFDVKTRVLFTHKEYQVQSGPANAGGPYSGEKDENIIFDGSKSMIPLVSGVMYRWDFGDRFDRTLGYGLHPKHRYSVPGTYIATLTIIKPDGERYQDVTMVDIGRDVDHLHPITACRYTGNVDEPVVFDASRSFSSESGNPITNYIWHFGDGTVGYGEKVTHTYSAARVYLVTLEIRDSEGNMRQDILHADIEHEYTSIKDLYLNYDGVFADLLDLILNSIGGRPILCDLFDVKIYYKYVDSEGNEEEAAIKIYNLVDDFPKKIDIDNDEIADVTVNSVKLFNLVDGWIYESPFNDFPGIGWETTVSDISINKNGGVVTRDGELTVCLQFSLGKLNDIFEAFGLDYLVFDEPIVRIGYYSAAGEEKASSFTAKHIFCPYLLYRLIDGYGDGGGNAQQQGILDVNAYPVQLSADQQSTTQEQTMQLPGATGCGGEQPKPAPTLLMKKMNILPVGNVYNDYQPLGDSWDIYPEDSVQVESSDVDRFSLFISFSDKETYATEETSLKLIFDSFENAILTHRKGKTLRDVDFKGANEDSALTLSLSRKKDDNTATLGIVIDPIQNFGFHFDMYKTSDKVRHVDFDVDNPPENIVLFTKSEDEQGEETSNYVYIRNIPNSLKFELLPRLRDGYISVTREETDDFTVGITDDLDDPNADIYISTTRPEKETRIDWSILPEDYNTITLSSTTTGLYLHGELKVENLYIGRSSGDINREISTVTVDIRVNLDLDISFIWSIIDGYFELRRSPLDIDFNFSVVKPNVLLDVDGNFHGSDKGFSIDFNGLETGKVEITNGFAFDVKIHAENLETITEIDTGLSIDMEGSITLEWDRSAELNLASDITVDLSNLKLSNPDGSITADKIILRGGLGLLIKPSEKYYEITSTKYFKFESLSIKYRDALDFSIESFEMNRKKAFGRTTWFDFSSNHKFNIECASDLSIKNLNLVVGDIVDFGMPYLDIVNNNGSIYGEWGSSDNDNPYLYLDADIDFQWDISIETQSFGDWETHGKLEGSTSLDAEWDPELLVGSIGFMINEPGLKHNLTIIHNDMTLELGTIDFEPGTITFEWQNERSTPHSYVPGRLNILNDDVSGSLSLFKLTYNDADGPIEFDLGTITITPGDTNITWTKINQKTIIIENTASYSLDFIQIITGEKSVSLSGLTLKPGQFRFQADPVNKFIKVQNSMASFGPKCTYEDTGANLSLSVDMNGLTSDYSKIMLLQWYTDADGKVNGIKIDTDNTNLVKWIEFEVIKDGTGRRLALSGLKAENLTIKKADGIIPIEISGKLHIANNLTYSRLVDLETDEWENLYVEWDLKPSSEVKSIKFDSEFDLVLDLLSVEILGFNFDASINLTDQMEIKWDLDGAGLFYLDTDNETISSATFTMTHSSGIGLQIVGGGLQADNFKVTWSVWKGKINVDGYIDYESIAIKGTINGGSSWWQIYPSEQPS